MLIEPDLILTAKYLEGLFEVGKQRQPVIMAQNIIIPRSFSYAFYNDREGVESMLALTLQCQTLVIGDDCMIDLSGKPGIDQAKDANSRDGYPGGAITLRADAIKSDGTKHMALKVAGGAGGRGVEGMPGEPGANGKNGTDDKAHYDKGCCVGQDFKGIDWGEKAQAGFQGSPGENGSDGGNGGPGGLIKIDITPEGAEHLVVFQAEITGGKFGEGGKGGQGGVGGIGGQEGVRYRVEKVTEQVEGVRGQVITKSFQQPVINYDSPKVAPNGPDGPNGNDGSHGSMGKNGTFEPSILTSQEIYSQYTVTLDDIQNTLKTLHLDAEILEKIYCSSPDAGNLKTLLGDKADFVQWLFSIAKAKGFALNFSRNTEVLGF